MPILICFDGCSETLTVNVLEIFPAMRCNLVAISETNSYRTQNKKLLIYIPRLRNTFQAILFWQLACSMRVWLNGAKQGRSVYNININYNYDTGQIYTFAATKVFFTRFSSKAPRTTTSRLNRYASRFAYTDCISFGQSSKHQTTDPLLHYQAILYMVILLASSHSL